MTTNELLAQMYPYFDYPTKKILVSEVPLSNTEVLICTGAVVIPLLITAYLLWKIEND